MDYHRLPNTRKASKILRILNLIKLMSSLYQMLSELVQITHSAGKPIVSMGVNLKIYRTEKFNIIIALFKD